MEERKSLLIKAVNIMHNTVRMHRVYTLVYCVLASMHVCAECWCSQENTGLMPIERKSDVIHHVQARTRVLRGVHTYSSRVLGILLTSSIILAPRVAIITTATNSTCST